jgi:sec-independent protein translocase protein TatA
MPDVSPIQLVIVLVIALVILGPKRLPDVGKSLGRGIREFKDSVSGHETPAPPVARLDVTPLDDSPVTPEEHRTQRADSTVVKAT